MATAEIMSTKTASIAIPIDQPKYCPDIRNSIPFIIASITKARIRIANILNERK